MRHSPWLPILVLVALGLYFAPRDAGTNFDFNFEFSPVPRLEAPQNLPEDVQVLFDKSRSSTVRVEQTNSTYGEPGAIGTGFFIDKLGTLLTAYHVVDGARYLNITTSDGARYAAELVGFDAARDIAVLRAAVREDVPHLDLADRSPRVGENVLAIGNSRGQFLQPRRGRMLRLNAGAARADFPQGTLEMSAPLAPGDSGGPILNDAGQVVGVVSYIRLAETELPVPRSNALSDMQTLASYAVPVKAGSEILAALIEGERRDVPALGIEGSPHSYTARGAAIFRVIPGSPAAEAGLRGERAVTVRDGSGERRQALITDVIVAVDDQPTGDFNELLFQIRQKAIGETVTLTVSRGGQQLELPVTLGPRSEVLNGG